MAIYALNDFLRNTPNTLSKKYLKDKSFLKDFTWTKEQDKETVQIGETEIENLADALDLHLGYPPYRPRSISQFLRISCAHVKAPENSLCFSTHEYTVA